VFERFVYSVHAGFGSHIMYLMVSKGKAGWA